MGGDIRRFLLSWAGNQDRKVVWIKRDDHFSEDQRLERMRKQAMQDGYDRAVGKHG